MLWLAACAPERGGGGPIRVTATIDRAAADFGVVRVTGMSPNDLRRAPVDTSILAIYAVSDSVAPGTPPLAGTWHQSADTMLFSPRFPPSSGMVLWVRAAPSAGGDGAQAQWWRFDLPVAADDTTPPRILAIHPSADTLPENLLRWYLEFSQPMRPGQARDHVHLFDDQGQVDETAFLDTSEELWDPDGRRLTLLFDPGRVKRGIRTNLEQGRPLQAGRAYRLRIDPGWEDLSGQVLSTPVERTIVVAPADHVGPDPLAWALQLPVVGTTDPLQASFGEPLDHALAGRLIHVLDPRGRRVTGQGQLREADRVWSFVPDSAWSNGIHQIEVSPELEDPAGNRPGLAFDHASTASPGGGARSRPIVRAFAPRSPSS